MSVLVIGASSQIGYFYLRRLLAVGKTALAVSRQPRMNSADGQLRWLCGDVQELPALTELDAIVSFGPLVGLAGWLAGLQQAPARKLVATSSMSVVTKLDSCVDAERALVSQLLDGEQQLLDECARLGIRCTILRPTLVYGAGRDRSLTPLAQRGYRWRVFALPAGQGWRQPVHADDLAMAVERCLQRDIPDGLRLQIGGGERLRARSMFVRVRQALTVPTVALPVPRLALVLAARVLARVRGPVSRLDQDLVADNAQIQALLGFSPRDFQLTPDMLGVGAQWQQALLDRGLRRGEA